MRRPWPMPACTLGQSWTSGWRARSGSSIFLDLGEADYGMGYQDAQKEIFRLLKAWDMTFSPTSWGLLDIVTPEDT
nr:MAP7 domain-containing protein 1-like [Ipomoea batatas]